MPVEMEMTQVDASFAHIANVRIGEFSDLSMPGGEQNATIKVRNNTFNVKVGLDGDVSVRFKGYSLFNLFRLHTRTRLAEQLRAQVADWRASIAKPEGEALKQKISASTEKAFADTFGPDPETGKISAGGSEVAVYGFSEIRGDNEASAMAHNISYSMIDDYNRGIGIHPEGLLLSRLDERLDKIKTGQSNIYPMEKGINDRKKLQAWADFLARPENLKKIDIMGRLKEYIAIGENPTKADKQLTGWKGEFARKGVDAAMQSFVRKNLPGSSLQIQLQSGKNTEKTPMTDELISVLADTLTILVDQCYRNFTTANINAALDEAARINGLAISPRMRSALSDVLDEVVASAFFRQTSKLGLEFFKERRTPVMFYWTNHQGQTISENNRALTNKWWKNPGESVHKHYGASITYSEMRHVQKMQQREQQALIQGDVDPLVLMKITGQAV